MPHGRAAVRMSQRLVPATPRIAAEAARACSAQSRWHRRAHRAAHGQSASRCLASLWRRCNPLRDGLADGCSTAKRAAIRSWVLNLGLALAGLVPYLPLQCTQGQAKPVSIVIGCNGRARRVGSTDLAHATAAQIDCTENQQAIWRGTPGLGRRQQCTHRQPVQAVANPWQAGPGACIQRQHPHVREYRTCMITPPEARAVSSGARGARAKKKLSRVCMQPGQEQALAILTLL